MFTAGGSNKKRDFSPETYICDRQVGGKSFRRITLIPSDPVLLHPFPLKSLIIIRNLRPTYLVEEIFSENLGALGAV